MITSYRSPRKRTRLGLEGLETRALLSNAGVLDPNFGAGNGYVTAPVGADFGESAGVAVQPDGKIVVAGNSGLARMNQDGTLDPTFGVGGDAVTATGVGGIVVLEPDGKIAVAGNIVTMDASNIFPVVTDVVIEQFLADGMPDPSFGSDGVAKFPASSFLSISTLGVLPDDQLVLGGLTVSPTTYDPTHGVYVTTSQPAAARLNLDGSLDTSFGSNGLASVPVQINGNSVVSINAIAIQPDGKVLLGGYAITDVVFPSGAGEVNNYSDGIVIRLDADGTLDTGFGGPQSAGIVTIPPDLSDPSALGSISVVGLALQHDGKIVAENGNGLISRGNFSVARLNADGMLDTSFGQGGEATIDGASAYAGLAVGYVGRGGVAVQPDGEIVAALGVEVLGANGVTYEYGTLVTRFNPDGTPDSTFGNPSDPGATILYVKDNSTYLTALALDPAGNIVLAGNTSDYQKLDFPMTFAVARLSGQPGTGTDEPGPIAASSGFPAGGNPNPGTGTNPGSGPYPVIGIGPIGVANPIVVSPTPTSVRSLPPADYDGSGKSDLATYLPSLGEFAYRPANGGPDVLVPFGIAGPGQTIPAPGDYTGAGRTEIAAYLPSLGVYAIRPADGSPDSLIPFGLAGAGQSVPAPGDYQGMGRDNLAVYMPSLGEFAIRSLTGGPDMMIPFGMTGAGQTIPAPGDYFGTGRTDIAAYLPSLGAFAIRNKGGGPDEIIPFGLPGLGQSIPVPGDYDGSGKTELAVYMPSLGLFAYRPANGGPDVIVAMGTTGAGAIPVPGDYDGSGKTEIGVYDPNNGTFAYRPSTGADVVVPFGMAGPAQSLPLAIQPGALIAIQLASPADLEVTVIQPSLSQEAATNAPGLPSPLTRTRLALASTDLSKPHS